MFSLPISRNVLSHTFVFGKHRRAAFEIAQLTHDLYVSILDPEFGDHDFWFLNVHAKRFCEDAEEYGYYPEIQKLIQELFDSVPLEKRGKLKWEGPNA